MKRPIFALLLTPLLLGATALAAPVRATKECSFLLPESLAESLGRLHPGAKVLTLNQLHRRERRLFKNEEGRRCPGIVHLDFFGDHREAYGVVLVTGAAQQRRLRLILAFRAEPASAWKIETLDTRKDPSLATVAKKAPGVYEDIHHKKKIEASAEALVWVRWDSWAILYAWTGQKIDKIWLQTSAPNRSRVENRSGKPTAVGSAGFAGAKSFPRNQETWAPGGDSRRFCLSSGFGFRFELSRPPSAQRMPRPKARAQGV